MEQQQQQGAQRTGTRNDTYDVIAVLYHALQGAEHCQVYARDAQDERIRGFFHNALSVQRQLADEGNKLLEQVLEKDTGGQSAFGWKSPSPPAATSNVQSTSTDGQTNPNRSS